MKKTVSETTQSRRDHNTAKVTITNPSWRAGERSKQEQSRASQRIAENNFASVQINNGNKDKIIKYVQKWHIHTPS